MRVEGGGLTFHDRLQEVCTKNETVVADDNSEWIEGFGEYMEGPLKEIIAEFEEKNDVDAWEAEFRKAIIGEFDNKDDFDDRVAELSRELRPEIAEQIRGLDHQGLWDFLANSPKDKISANEAITINKMIWGKEYLKQKEEEEAQWHFYNSNVLMSQQEPVNLEAFLKVLMISAYADAYKDNPVRQKEMITEILSQKVD
jgi:hypothetical protein